MRVTELDVIIIAHQSDYHAQAVRQEVEALGRRAIIVDSGEFPRNLSLDFFVDQSRNALTLSHRDRDTTWRLTAETAVWWRRPRPHCVAGTYVHPKVESFASDECRQAFMGALAHTCVRFVNPYGASRHATFKLFQLRAAKDVGLPVPATLVTTVPDVAMRFIDARSRACVYKLFTGTDFGFYETRRFVNDDDVSSLELLRDCPIIIQEYVTGALDIRATIVGDDVFAAAIDMSASQHGVDSRVEKNPTVAFKLPTDVQRRLLNLATTLGLTYCAIDLRQDEDGQFVFLEVNPEGQYLWTEIEAGLPISAALAQLLTTSVQPVRLEKRDRDLQQTIVSDGSLAERLTTLTS